MKLLDGVAEQATALAALRLLPDSAQISGSAKYRGRELLNASKSVLRDVRGDDVSIIFQEPMTALNPLHTVERQIAESLRLHQGLRGGAARARVLELMNQVGIRDAESRLGAYPHQLSGGQQQRLALARAWALKPSVWLLDEPTASLDPHAKRDVEALIADFSDEAPAPGRQPPTLVFASHNLGQVKRLASRVIYLEQGVVLADLPVNDFFNQAFLEAHCPQAQLFVKGETT